MRRGITQGADSVPHIILGFTANYPESCASEGVPTMKICVIYDMSPYPGRLRRILPSQRYIGDLRVAIREIRSLPDAETAFEHLETTFLAADGSTGRSRLNLARALKAILRRTIEYIVGVFGGPLSIALGTMWDLLAKDHEQKRHTRELEFEFFKWWSFIKWQNRPGSILIDLRHWIEPGLGSSGTVSGVAEYEILTRGQVGRPWSPLRLGRWGATVIDDLEAIGQYTTTWEEV